MSELDVRRKTSETRNSPENFTNESRTKSSLEIHSIGKSSLLPVSPSMHSNGITRGGQNGDSRRSSMVDSTGRFCSQPINGSSEILVGLCYDDKHEVVSVTIDKASSIVMSPSPTSSSSSTDTTMTTPPAHPLDSYVRIVGVDEFGGELSRHKTDTAKHTAQPVYNYHCTIRVSRDKVETSTIRIEIWVVSGILRRKHQVGSIAIGYASSTPDANEHWQQMMQGSGITVSKWHPIQAPDLN